VNLKAGAGVVAGRRGPGQRDNSTDPSSGGRAGDRGRRGGGQPGRRWTGGYIGKEHQVGQTGTTVRPGTVHLACGISGAVQHSGGDGGVAKIVAINTDREAPIFFGGALRESWAT